MNEEARTAGRLATEVAQAVGEIQRVAELEKAVEVGQVVVDNLYEGDLQQLRNRGSSDLALRLVAFHPELPLSPAELYDTVGIYEALETFGGLDRCRHLGVDHIRAVLRLPPYRQQALLLQAEQRCWSADRLRRAVRDESVQWALPASVALASCTAPSAA